MMAHVFQQGIQRGRVPSPRSITPRSTPIIQDGPQIGLFVPGAPMSPCEGRAQHYTRAGNSREQATKHFSNGTTLKFGKNDQIDIFGPDDAFYEQVLDIAGAERELHLVISRTKGTTASSGGSVVSVSTSEINRRRNLSVSSFKTQVKLHSRASSISPFPDFVDSFEESIPTFTTNVRANQPPLISVYQSRHGLCNTPGASYDGNSSDKRFGLRERDLKVRGWGDHMHSKKPHQNELLKTSTAQENFQTSPGSLTEDAEEFDASVAAERYRSEVVAAQLAQGDEFERGFAAAMALQKPAEIHGTIPPTKPYESFTSGSVQTLTRKMARAPAFAHGEGHRRSTPVATDRHCPPRGRLDHEKQKPAVVGNMDHEPDQVLYEQYRVAHSNQVAAKVKAYGAWLSNSSVQVVAQEAERSYGLMFSVVVVAEPMIDPMQTSTYRAYRIAPTEASNLPGVTDVRKPNKWLYDLMLQSNVNALYNANPPRWPFGHILASVDPLARAFAQQVMHGNVLVGAPAFRPPKTREGRQSLSKAAVMLLEKLSINQAQKYPVSVSTALTAPTESFRPQELTQKQIRALKIALNMADVSSTDLVNGGEQCLDALVELDDHQHEYHATTTEPLAGPAQSLAQTMLRPEDGFHRFQRSGPANVERTFAPAQQAAALQPNQNQDYRRTSSGVPISSRRMPQSASPSSATSVVFQVEERGLGANGTGLPRHSPAMQFAAPIHNQFLGHGSTTHDGASHMTFADRFLLRSEQYQAPSFRSASADVRPAVYTPSPSLQVFTPSHRRGSSGDIWPRVTPQFHFS